MLTEIDSMQKSIRVTAHARRRMARYRVGEDFVIHALREPNYVVTGCHGRKIAHNFMNDLVWRVVYEEDDVTVVVTVYPARRERYAKVV